MALELSVHFHQAYPLPQQHLHHLPSCRFRPRACPLSHHGGASLPPRPLSCASAAFSSIPPAPIPSTPHASSTLQVLKRICALTLPASSCYAAVILTITVSQAAWVLLVILRGRPSSCASLDQDADYVNELLTERRVSTAEALLNRVKLYLGLNYPQNISIQQEVHDVNQLLTGKRLGTAQKLLSRLERLQCFRKVGLVEQGGLGLALLSTTAMAKDHISPVLATLCANPTFMSALVAWAIAQVLKVFTTFFAERRWDLKKLVGSGGMPSSHSALCVALTTSVALCHGISDALFPVCLGFTLIVMYDATGVRRHAGMQAEVLNLIVEDMFQGHRVSEKKLKELLGHTPLQVGAGAVLGMVTGYLCSQGYQAFPGHAL